MNRGWKTCKDQREHWFRGKSRISLCGESKFPRFRSYKKLDMGYDDSNRPKNICQICVDEFVFTT